MADSLLIALKLDVLLGDSEMGKDEPKVWPFIGEHKYLVIGKFFHPQGDDGLEAGAVVFLDVLHQLLQLDVDVLAEN